MTSKSHASDNPDDVVISGISGVFPNSENVEQFKNNLLDRIDMTSLADRSNMADTGSGLIKNIDRFDHSFFHLTRKQADSIPVSTRILLEKSFEAVLDSGHNPEQLKSKNIAVICCVSEQTVQHSEKISEGASAQIEKNFVTIANAVSNYFGFRGLSLPLHTTTSSSVHALDLAIRHVREGEFEGALVCAANFCSPDRDDAHTRNAPFDANGNGYVKSEAAVAIFIQKRNLARRVYATIVNIKVTIDESEPTGNYQSTIDHQKKLYKFFYNEIDVKPQEISYLEAYATGSKQEDAVEGASIEAFFCQGRTTPLKIGSVKSNMGHSKAAAALCSIIKMIISFETRFIPANINYNSPNPAISGLFDGHLKVITEPTPLQGEYFAINSFEMDGVNGHILLRAHNRTKNSHSYETVRIPKLVTVSARTEHAIEYILSEVEKHIDHAEYTRLLHEIFSDDISDHLYRGYIISSTKNEITKSKKLHSGEKRPIWFFFSGLGSQWPTMGISLMQIPIFAKSIQNTHQVLLSKGLDLIKMITEDDPNMFENILHSLVGITAIQIGLTDILTSLGVTPDGIIGHSHGELACAYVDGCLTAEQTILLAYYRGLVFAQAELIHGATGVIGIGDKDLINIIPPEIDIACYNNPSCCTFTGPAEIVREFIKQQQEKNVFACEVPTLNTCSHSRYTKALGPEFLSHFKTVISEPKLRSEKWISTSALEHDWNKDSVKYSSAEYHANNVLVPVYFEQSCRHIPDNAVIIEIAPHGMMNSVLKHMFPDSVDNIRLTNKNEENLVEYLLNALGLIYELGCALKLDRLYPTVEFPVSRSTPMISPLIIWQREEQSSTSMAQTPPSSKIGEPNDSSRSKSHNEIKNSENFETVQIPKLVAVWGKTEQEIECILSDVEKNIDDVEYTREMREIFSKNTSDHLHRGYILASTNGEITRSKKLYFGEKRPLWFFYSGLESQWPTMGKSLMQIPIFAKSIYNIHRILQSKGLDLIKMITDDDLKIFESILNIFVGITSIQIALTDTLRAIGLEPDGIIGQSLGELACAYADGCLTTEQTILISYYTGLHTAQTEYVPCSMGAIGMPYEDLIKVMPPELEIGCHNGPGSYTVCGPKEILTNFINEQKKKNVFAFELKASNAVYHSRYMANIVPKLLSQFKSIIPDPKPRSKKWICTSALEHDWNTDWVKYSSAEHHAENLMHTVYFEEAYRHIPNNAVMVEIAPHALLMPVLRMLFHDSVEKISLTSREHENNAEYFLNALGQMYEMGYEMKLDLLYQPVDIPAVKSTPIISPQAK